MGIVMAMSFFFIIVTMVFIAIAVFLPEWLGITGKKAKQIISEHGENAKKADASKSEETKSDKN